MIHIQYINKKEASKVVVYKNQNVYTNTRIEGSWDFRICAAIIKKKCVCARVKINAFFFFVNVSRIIWYYILRIIIN